MGFLEVGQPLEWKESLAVIEYIRKHGIKQVRARHTRPRPDRAPVSVRCVSVCGSNGSGLLYAGPKEEYVDPYVTSPAGQGR